MRDACRHQSEVRVEKCSASKAYPQDTTTLCCGNRLFSTTTTDYDLLAVSGSLTSILRRCSPINDGTWYRLTATVDLEKAWRF